MKLYRAIARAVALHNASSQPGRIDYQDRAEMLVKEHLPSGSGFDNGTKLDWNKSNLKRLVFIVGFHHMDDHGYYVGWTHHQVIFTANLDGHTLRVTGKDKRAIKEYIADVFDGALNDIDIDAY